MNKILISVILPFYNAESTLERAIVSIAKQSFEGFECILVNNNSTDKSAAIANHWVEKDRRFKLIVEGTQGVVFASNAGAKLAKGKYIARMDADDVALPDRLKQSFVFLETNPDFGAVAGTVKYVPHKDKTDGFARYVDWSNSVKSYEQICLKQFIEAPIVNPTAMWRKSLGQALAMYKSGDFPEDYEMWLRWIEAGVKIHKIDNHFIDWHDSDTRLTRTNAVYDDEAFFKIKSVYLNRWLQKNNPHYPQVMVWGASKTSRKRLSYLKDLGIDTTAYIDVKKTRQLDAPVCFYENLPDPGEVFILVYMKMITERERIDHFLKQRGYVEGLNYVFAS